MSTSAAMWLTLASDLRLHRATLPDVDGDIIYASDGSSSDLCNYTDSRHPSARSSSRCCPAVPTAA